MTKRRANDDDEEIVQSPAIGVVSTTLGPIDKPSKGKRRRKRRMKRPIGFMANIDRLEPIDD